MLWNNIGIVKKPFNHIKVTWDYEIIGTGNNQKQNIHVVFILQLSKNTTKYVQTLCESVRKAL